MLHSIAVMGNPWRRLRNLVRAQWVLIGCGVLFIEMAFALYTRDAWEDFYITFRASRNLAMGNGLVFNPGERVHSFTSPLHTLLLAGLSFLTGNVSEQPVLWLSRILLSGVLAGAVVLMLRVCRQARFALAATVFLALFLMVDAKTVDFTINGMEVPLMLFFLALALSVHVRPGRPWNWQLLGIAWAGLQWTRPDGFMYGGLLAAGFLLFPTREDSITRKNVWSLYWKAGAFSVLLYLPWLLGAWYYYGSPIPHPLTARFGSVHNLLSLPPRLWFNLFFTRTLDAMFAPPYSTYLPGWFPPINTVYSRGLALVAALYWLAPFGRPVGRAASFGFMCMCIYIAFMIQIPMPWYLPGVALLGVTALADLISVLLDWGRGTSKRKMARYGVLGVLAVVLAVQLVLTVCVANLLRVNQTVLEDGNRKQVGLWLHEHANPHDTVFLECLGYIGYFSQLKIYDYPGLSSPEVVAARRRVGDDYARLVRLLKPTWLALRPFEIQDIKSHDPALLKTDYAPVKVFDVSSKLARYAKMPGIGLLNIDRTFVVYQRKLP